MSFYDLALPAGPLSLFAAGIYLFLCGGILKRRRWLNRLVVFLATAIALTSQFLLAYGLFEGTRVPFANLFKWSPQASFEVSVAFKADFLSLFFGLPLALLSFLVCGYLLMRVPEQEYYAGIRRGNLYGLLLLSEGAGLCAFYAADLVFFFGWVEALGLFLYLLSGPGLSGANSSKFSYQAYCTSIFGGFMLLAPLLVIVSRNGGAARFDQLTGSTVDLLLFSVAVVGLLVKAAQFPFQAIFSRLKELPAAVHTMLVIGAIFPLVVYLPARLQQAVGERIDLFRSIDWLFIFTGSFTIFSCSWLVFRETALIYRTSILCSGAFGFVLIALGSGDFSSALWQLLGISLGGTLLFLAGDLLQTEIDTPPHDPQNAARTIPVQRPPLFRSWLVICYILGAGTLLGLPFTPAYTARWITISHLLEGGYRVFFGLVLLGLFLMALSVVQNFALYLLAPLNTIVMAGPRKFLLWIPLGPPFLLAAAIIFTGLAPLAPGNLLTSIESQVYAGNNPSPADFIFGPAGVAALLILAGIAGAYYTPSRTQRMRPAASFNGGALFGNEAETERKLRLSKTRALVLPEEEDAFGFEDEFFKVGLKHNLAPPPPRLEAAISPADYFQPLLDRLKIPLRLVDSNYSGNIIYKAANWVLNFVRRALEWLTERFYPALAAFLVLIFIFLLTR